jgi:hypothetical protein
MSYSGIFIRDELGQQPCQPSAGWSDSPDILFAGPTIVDPRQYTTAASYATRTSNVVHTGVMNYVYLRGQNTNSGPQASNMFFYYTESDLVLWPKNWRGDNITVSGAKQNWSALEASTNGAIAVTAEGFVWTPPPLSGSAYDHYCVIAWADNSGTPVPPDFGTFNQFSSCEQLAAFVQSHPNMGWCNTSDIYETPAQYSYSTGLGLQDQGGTVNLSISFIDIPGDGTFSVMLQGTDASNTINKQGLNISDYQGGFNQPGLSFPPQFDTSVQVQWFKGATDPTPAAEVKVSLTIDASSDLIAECRCQGVAVSDIRVELFEATHILPHQRGTLFRPTPVVLLGRQNWSMHYGVAAPVWPATARGE